MKRTWLPLLLALLVLPLAAACSSKSDSAETGATATPGEASPSATASATRPGDDSEPLPPGLQQVLDDVAEIRKLPAPPALEANLVARSDLPELLDNLLTDDDRRWFANTTTLYRLLGHFSDDQDYLTVWQSFGGEAVLGLYSPLDDELWVVYDDGQTPDFDNLPRQEQETLAHELVHAIQDYNFKLDEVYVRTVDSLDWNMASTCVVEGDASTHEAIYSRDHLAVPLPSGRAFLLADLSQITDVPPSIARELLFPYTTGAEWVRGIVQKSGTGPIDRMLQDPPRGTAYVLHPELLDNGFQPANVTLPDLRTVLGTGWTRESGGQWGEFGMRNYLQLRIRSLDASNAAAGWAGDRYDVYANGGEAVALFRITFRDATEATQFATAQKQYLNGFSSVTEGALTIAQERDGDTTVIAPTNGSDYIFAIGTSKDIAVKAVQALAGS